MRYSSVISVESVASTFQRRNFRTPGPVRSLAILATTLPPRSTAPITGVFVEPPGLRPFVVIPLVRLTRPPAYVSLVGLDDPAKQDMALLVGHFGADSDLHVPGRLGIQLKMAGQLFARQAFLGVDYQAQTEEPLLQGDFRLGEDNPAQVVKARLAVVAAPAAYAVILGFAGYVERAAERAYRVASGTAGASRLAECAYSAFILSTASMTAAQMYSFCSSVISG